MQFTADLDSALTPLTAVSEQMWQRERLLASLRPKLGAIINLAGLHHVVKLLNRERAGASHPSRASA